MARPAGTVDLLLGYRRQLGDSYALRDPDRAAADELGALVAMPAIG